MSYEYGKKYRTLEEPKRTIKECRVLVHKETAELVCARYLALVRGKVETNFGCVIALANEGQIAGYAVDFYNQTMLMGKRYVEENFEDLGEL